MRRDFVPLTSAATSQELIRVLAFPGFRLDPHGIEALLPDYLPFTETVQVVPGQAIVPETPDPAEGLADRFWTLAPDLVVEVVSPSNRASEMQRKALDYLDAGARLVWIVGPAARSVAAYRS